MQRIITAMFLFLLGLSTLGFTQHLNFQQWSINDGLSQSVVNCVFQDSKGFIWIGTQNGLNRFDGYDFIYFLNDPADETTLCGNWVYDIVEDNRGLLWIGTKNGVCTYDREANVFEKITLQADSLTYFSEIVYGLDVAQSGNVLMNTPAYVFIYNLETSETKAYLKKSSDYQSVTDQSVAIKELQDGQILAGSKNELCIINPIQGTSSVVVDEHLQFGEISVLYEDNIGRVWVGARNGLFVKQMNTDAYESVEELQGVWTRSVIQEKNGRIWIGTEGGWFKLEMPKSGALREITIELLDLSIVLDQMIDNSDNLWLGTIQGLSKADLKPPQFQLFRGGVGDAGYDLSFNVIASIFKMNDSILWVGTWGRGLNILNRLSREVTHYTTNKTGRLNIENDYIHVIFRDEKQRIWIGTRDGLFVFNEKTASFVRPKHKVNNMPPALEDHRIYMMIQDNEQRFWIGTQKGIYIFDERDGNLLHLSNELSSKKRLSNNLVYALLLDENTMWVATSDGLNRIDVETFENTVYKYDVENKQTINDNFVVSLAKINDKIWIGTLNGLNYYDKKTQKFVRYSDKYSMVKKLIYEIVVDNNENMWLATQDGLLKLNPRTNELQQYTVKDGLQSQEFNIRARYKSEDGELFFGGMNGFNAFYPDSLKMNDYVPNTKISSISYRMSNGSKVNEILIPDEIVLPHDVFDIEMKFAALDFTNPNKSYYQYLMKGLSDEWIDIGYRRYVLFSNLLPGEYFFQVKGTNNDGVWGKHSRMIKIIIKSPWYKTIWALTFYVIAVIFFIYMMFKIRQSRLVKERDLLTENERLLIRAKEKAEESDRLKSAFLTNMSHEIRTPLNGILGFSKMLLKPNLKPEKLERYSKVIIENGNQLLHIVNDILDISMIEAGQLKLDKQPVSLHSFMQSLESAFLPAAKDKGLELQYEFKKDGSLITDEFRLKQIMSNLISNAIKFTDSGTVVFGFEPKDNQITFFVKDSGIGIAAENLENIFKPFRQVEWEHAKKKGGNGLGLSISKELVEMLGGKLEVESTPGNGALFTFSLPIS
jgi:signal transduction histidine kinase/ligand-binding sensor domain-containing protein